MLQTIITFGEALLRLAPPNHLRLEQARSLDVEVGGAELNTAVGLARLGHSAAWVSRVPTSPLGDLVRNRVREAGVSDEHVKSVNDGRCGVYFLEQGAAPRASAILYDRKDSSISRVTAGEFAWPRIMTGAKWFHVTGITAALSEGAAAVCLEAMVAAKAAGLSVSVDLNYRSKLWTAADAGRVMSMLLRHCDVLIASENDAAQLFNITGKDFAEVAAKLTGRFELNVVASIRREATQIWHDRIHAVAFSNGTLLESQPIDVEVVDRLGTGDAFAAGLIHGLLNNHLQQGLDTGTAMAALKHTIVGDLPLMTADEIEAVMTGEGLRIRR
ncbi:sugar kinase [soil metagenome]